MVNAFDATCLGSPGVFGRITQLISFFETLRKRVR